MSNNVILGAGIAGISAAYHLKQKGENSVIFEKDNDWGGLCGFFEIDGFRFDRFVHFTFAKDEKIAELFAKSSPLYEWRPSSWKPSGLAIDSMFRRCRKFCAELLPNNKKTFITPSL